jgi:serine/threonine-protein kinase
MAYCHKCSSGVDIKSVFCPYCGTSLEFGANKEASSADVQNESNSSTAPVEEIIDSETMAAANEKDIEQASVQGFVDDEQETIIQPVNLSSPNLTDQPPASDFANELDSESSTSQTESSLMHYEEAPVKEGLEVFEEEFPHDISEAGNDNKDAGEVPFNEQKTLESPNSKLKPEPAEAASDTPIAKPEIALESVEKACPPSQFDSVRIIENVHYKNKNQTTQNPASRVENKSENAEKIDLQKAVEDEQKRDEQKKANTYTTPNIGKSDTDGKKSTKLKPLDEGTILNNRYEIVRKIGGGGMGAVYLASDKNLGGVLRAVKEMVQSYIEGEQQDKAVNDFKRESLLLTSLDNQSIPTIYDYFYDEQEARFYLVMKYISGGDLAARLRSASEGRIPEKDVTEWAIQIADVLDYLHNRQPPIVYRDLKPANIMIDGSTGRVMLIDFGIARWVNKEEKGVTAVGTMGYAPPELFSGNVEPRSDIYSLGSTMFHLLTGADPQSNPLLIFDFQKHPLPRQINPQLSDQIEKILLRMVEYNADQRYATAAELARALREHFEKLKNNTATFGVRDVPTPIGLSEQPVFCGFCGQKIVATDLFCAFCGARQPLAQQGVHSANYKSVTPTAKLLILGTSELEMPAFKIEKEENLLGRRDPMSNIFPEVDLSKFDPQTKISRKHARIWREGNNFLLEDLGSSNGTLVLPIVNETVRLKPHKPYTLTNGDKLKLGDTTLHFVIG